MICCLNISKSSQMQFKVYPEEGKALTSYFPSWLNLLRRKNSQWRNICLLKTKTDPQAVIIKKESKMGFETLSKPFQGKAAFSALAKVISQTLPFSSFKSSNPAVHRDAGCRNLPPAPEGPQQSFAVSLCKLSLLHLPILLNSKFKALLDFLTQLFFPKDQSEVPFPLPSERASLHPKRGCPLPMHIVISTTGRAGVALGTLGKIWFYVEILWFSTL